MLILTPAVYTGDFKSRNSVVKAFNDNKDFIIQNVDNMYCGKPCNKADLIGAGQIGHKVQLRYNKTTRVVIVTINK